MHDTLLSDIDTSITVWYILYCVSNAFLVGASVIVVGLPALTAAEVLSPEMGGPSCGMRCAPCLSWLERCVGQLYQSAQRSADRENITTIPTKTATS